ncbi:TonB-dependent receptor [Brevundimonas sp. PAMC22021]|nr:TonB-dependent receptor [Brevundimonas sp. PAMC22021]
MVPSVSHAQDAAGHAAALDDVVVTGSLIRGESAATPVETVERVTLEAAGVLDASGLVRLVAANSGSEAQVDQLNQPQSSGTAQFNLRNLGLGSTLVLVNGRRQTASAVTATDGSSFVDINSLVPLIALQWVDVLKDGASATYGSDAVAGVVNFVTRQDVERPEVRVRYAAADGSDETTLEAIGGGEVLGGPLVLAGSFYHRSSLGSDDRDFTQAETYGLAPWTAVTSYGQPGSYFRASTRAFSPDPDCDNPAFGSAYRTGAADTFCRLDYSDFFDLVPEEDRMQLFATWRRPLAGNIDLSLEAAWSRNQTWVRQSPSLPILARTVIVPASHPDNPFGEDVLFRGRLLGAEAGASSAVFDYDTRRIAGALDGTLASGWDWSLSSTFSRQTVFYNKPDVIGSALQNALNGLGGAGCDPATGTPGVGDCRYFNPFGSAYLGTGTSNDAALIDSLTGYTGLRGSASLWTVDALTSGEAARWDGGALDLAIGVQARRSGYRQDWSDLANSGELLTAGVSPDFEGHEDAGAVFAEGRLRLGARFEAQLAARYESEGGADRLSPKVAASWTPIDPVTLRASYAQGFRSPSVYVRQGAQASQPSVLDRGAFVFVNTVTYGDPNLEPEDSENWNLGVAWRPLEGLQLSLDAWRFDYENLVVKETAQGLIDQAAADDRAGLTGTDAQTRVRRDAAGTLTFVALNFVNASSIETEGLDFAARYDRETDVGRLGASATWTYVDRYDIRLTPGAVATSGVGSTNLNTIGRSLPRNRGEFALSWALGAWSATGLAHYTSGYSNDRSGITDARIGSQTTVDLSASRTLGEDLTLSLGVVNLADRDPPLAQFALGYDPVVADPRGRVFTVGLSRRF